MQPNPEKMARAIAMSDRGLREWQDALKDCVIDTVNQLLDEVLVKTDITRPTAAKAFRGERLERATWTKIFITLDLKRETFFSDAEWHGWNRETLWKNLWGLAEDAEDRFGWVLPQQIKRVQESGFRDPFYMGYQKTLTAGTEVLMEIPAGLLGYLILVEQDPNGNIDLISPSCLVKNPELTGDIRLLPQYPPSPFKFVRPTTLGTNSLWAGIFTELPDWDWLEKAREGVLSLKEDHLMDLWDYASQPTQGNQIWRSSYVVVSH